MKKNLILLAFLFLYITNIQAQELQYGARLGVNLADINGDEFEEAKIKTGYHAGLYAIIEVADKVAIEPGLFISTKGMRAEGVGELDFFGIKVVYDMESKTSATYLDIPVLVRLSIASGFNVFIGPQFSYLLGNKYTIKSTYTLNGETETVSEKGSNTEGMSEIDLGLVFGVGYQLENGLNFNLGYDLGLSNINDSESRDDFKVSNRVIKISVGFNF